MSSSRSTDAPGALRDLQATLTVIQDQKKFGFTGGTEVEAAVGALYKGTPGIYGALFDTAIATATETMATLRTSASSYQPMADYSDKVKLVYSSKNQLAAALQLAAEVIVTGTGVKLLHVTLGGFDTHYTELNRHDDLMGYLDSAVSAFYQDLARTEGLPLPAATLDLRPGLSAILQARVGTIDEALTRLGCAPHPLGLDGRGGRRLQGLVAAVVALRARVV